MSRQLIKYAMPMVATNLLQALYSMVDLIIAGRFVGSGGISGINNGGQILNLVTQIVIGITIGGNILIGQYFGSGDQAKRQQAAGTLFTVSLVGGVLISVLLAGFAEPLLRAIGAPALEEARAYLLICALGMIFIFGYNALSAVLRAVGNSREPMIFIGIATVLNIVLDLLFMGVFDMGTAGAALATVIAQGVCFFLALGYLLRHPDIMRFTRADLRLVGSEFRQILKLGIPCSVQMTIAGISWLTVTFLVNTYGVDVSAGNGVACKIKDFCQLFISAMANSAATMIAQTLGARKYDRAKQVMYTAMRISVLMAVLLIVIVELFAPQLVAIFTRDPKVAEAAVLNLRIEIVGQIFYAMFLVYHALAIGAGHTMFAMGSSFVNCIVFRVILALALNHFFGLWGLYLACTIAPSSSVPLGWLYTRSGIWRRSLQETAATT